MTLAINQLTGFGGGGPLFSEPCNNITPWTDGDTGTGVSSQATFDGESTFKFDSGGTIGGRALRDYAPVIVPGRATITLRLYHSAIGVGPLSDQDSFSLLFTDGANTNSLHVHWASDGLFLNTAGTFAEIGTNIVSLGQWDTWAFVCNFGANTVNIYLNGVLQTAGTGMQVTGLGAGNIRLRQFSDITADRVSYMDWMTIE